MDLWVGGVAALCMDQIWRTFLPGWPHPQIVVLWLLRESVRRDDYQVPTFAFLAGAAWDATANGILCHHSVLWLILVLLARRLTLLVWFDYIVTQVLLAMLVSTMVRGGELMIWLPRWPTDVGETRILSDMAVGVVLDSLMFPLIWRIGRARRRRTLFGPAK